METGSNELKLELQKVDDQMKKKKKKKCPYLLGSEGFCRFFLKYGSKISM